MNFIARRLILFTNRIKNDATTHTSTQYIAFSTFRGTLVYNSEDMSVMSTKKFLHSFGSSFRSTRSKIQ